MTATWTPFAIWLQRDTTRELSPGFSPPRMTPPLAAPRCCRWASWGRSSRAIPCWARHFSDDDSVVRTMAEDALWAIWSRADTPEHNQALNQVQLAISREQLDQAEVLVTRLIAVAPNFAEAYNQRAIIYFLQGRFAESVQDCQQVLSRNPYHFGAISGMAQSQVRLNRPQDALKSLRRALKLQPHRDFPARNDPNPRGRDRIRRTAVSERLAQQRLPLALPCDRAIYPCFDGRLSEGGCGQAKASTTSGRAPR